MLLCQVDSEKSLSPNIMTYRHLRKAMKKSEEKRRKKREVKNVFVSYCPPRVWARGGSSRKALPVKGLGGVKRRSYAS